MVVPEESSHIIIVITGLDIDSTLSLCKDVAESIMAKVQGLIRK